MLNFRPFLSFWLNFLSLCISAISHKQRNPTNISKSVVGIFISLCITSPLYHVYFFSWFRLCLCISLSTPYFSFLLGIGARGRPEPRGNEGGQPNSTHLSSPQTELSSSPQPAAAPSGVTGGRPEASKVSISSATARAPTETPRGGLLVSRPLQELGGVRGEGQLAEQEVITVDLPDLSRLPEQPRSLGMSFQNLCLFYTFLFY